MQTKQWIRRGIVAVVWGLAAATWASIAHHLFGMPDLVPLLAIGAMAAVLAWPTKQMRAQVATSTARESSQRA
jgi:uncharacterized membrane protein YesL